MARANPRIISPSIPPPLSPTTPLFFLLVRSPFIILRLCSSLRCVFYPGVSVPLFPSHRVSASSSLPENLWSLLSSVKIQADGSRYTWIVPVFILFHDHSYDAVATHFADFRSASCDPVYYYRTIKGERKRWTRSVTRERPVWFFFSIGNRIVGARDSFEYQSLSYFPVEKFSRL